MISLPPRSSRFCVMVAIVSKMASLAHRSEVGWVTVLRSVVEVRNGEHDLHGVFGLNGMAPEGRVGLLANNSEPMRSTTSTLGKLMVIATLTLALTLASSSVETNGTAYLFPVARVPVTVVWMDRHQLNLSLNSANRFPSSVGVPHPQ